MKISWINLCFLCLIVKRKVASSTERVTLLRHSSDLPSWNSVQKVSILYNSAVLNLLRPKGLLQILSVGREPPLKIVSLALYGVLHKIRNSLCSRATRQMASEHWWRMRTTGILTYSDWWFILDWWCLQISKWLSINNLSFW